MKASEATEGRELRHQLKAFQPTDAVLFSVVKMPFFPHGVSPIPVFPNLLGPLTFHHGQRQERHPHHEAQDHQNVEDDHRRTPTSTAGLGVTCREIREGESKLRGLDVSDPFGITQGRTESTHPRGKGLMVVVSPPGCRHLQRGRKTWCF